jgi:hypothetical protein
MSLSESERTTLIKNLANAGFNNIEAERIIKTVIASNSSSFSEFVTHEYIREFEQRLLDRIEYNIKKEGRKTRKWVIVLCGIALLLTQLIPLYLLMYMKEVWLLN